MISPATIATRWNALVRAGRLLLPPVAGPGRGHGPRARRPGGHDGRGRRAGRPLPGGGRRAAVGGIRAAGRARHRARTLGGAARPRRRGGPPLRPQPAHAPGRHARPLPLRRRLLRPGLAGALDQLHPRPAGASSTASPACCGRAGATGWSTPTRSSTASGRTGTARATPSGSPTRTPRSTTATPAGTSTMPRATSRWVEGPREFRHRLGTMVNGLIERGLAAAGPVGGQRRRSRRRSPGRGGTSRPCCRRGLLCGRSDVIVLVTRPRRRLVLAIGR